MIRVEKTHLPVAALTHPGMKGKNNEDRFGVAAFRMKTQPPAPVLLAVLSDGIGGNRAGEVASELTVNQVIQLAADSDGKNPTRIMEAAIQQASQRIFMQAEQNPDQRGMGATCACVWISGERLYTATVGDSRIYLMRGESIQQLSTDHTWIQEALERGLIQPDEVNGHPNAHVIRRYLGSPTPPEVDFRIRLNGQEGEATHQGMPLEANDRVLVCSDGLTDLVSAEEILVAFQHNSLEEAGQQLINLANERGGHDNITIVAIQIPEEIESAAPVLAPAPVRSRSLIVGCLGIILLAALIGAVAGGYYLYFGGGTPTATPTATITLVPTFEPLRITGTPTPLPTLGSGVTPSPVGSPTGPTTPGPALMGPGLSVTITPWPTNTPGLPVVTVTR